MHHDTQVRLVERVLANLDTGTTDMEPAETRVPVSRYTDPERFERERDLVLRRFPRVVARSERVSRPGDFLTVDDGGVPILVVRGEDGALRAFLNVCRHRGTRVEGEASGCRKRFTCPYHAWTYDTNGVLRRIPDGFGFPGVTPAERGLVPLGACERHGFVWVLATPGATLAPEAIDAWLGPVGDDLESYGLATHVAYKPDRRELPLGWKLVFDIFLEAYHLRYAHAGTIYPMFFDNVAVCDRLGPAPGGGPHVRNLFPKRSIADLAGTPSEGWDVRPHSNLFYVLFPSSMMLVQPDHVSFFTVIPTGIDRCEISGTTLIPEAPGGPDAAKAERYWDANRAVLQGAIAEDFAVGISIQEGLASGANEELVFGRFEHPLAWMHASVDAAVRGDLTFEGAPSTRARPAATGTGG